jgi:hypothetical protein
MKEVIVRFIDARNFSMDHSIRRLRVDNNHVLNNAVLTDSNNFGPDLRKYLDQVICEQFGCSDMRGSGAR